MPRLQAMVVWGAAFLLPLLASNLAHAEDIVNAQQCHSAVKDTEKTISESPGLGEKSQKILLSVMELARQRCDEKQFANAKDLLDLARGMVASEGS